jgi:sarcosine oxidase subunit alpha
MAIASRPLARTPLHHWHRQHGAHFAENDGWQVAAAYTTLDAEITAARAALGLADLSAFTKTCILGQGVPAFTEALLGDSAASRPRGVGLLAAEAVLACRLTVDHLLLLASTTGALLTDRLAGLTPDQAVIQSDVTTAYAAFAIVGPHTADVLRRLTSLDVSPAALPVGACAETGVADVPALLVHTCELTVLSLRLHVAWDLAEFVWETVLDAGKSLGIAPIGLEAWRALRT